MTKTEQPTKHIASDELQVGDMIDLHLFGNHRVTGFEPYDGPLDCIRRIVCVEGRGPFISDDGTGWDVYSHSNAQ
jgi:hypothetical protein